MPGWSVVMAAKKKAGQNDNIPDVEIEVDDDFEAPTAWERLLNDNF